MTEESETRQAERTDSERHCITHEETVSLQPGGVEPFRLLASFVIDHFQVFGRELLFLLECQLRLLGFIDSELPDWSTDGLSFHNLSRLLQAWRNPVNLLIRINAFVGSVHLLVGPNHGKRLAHKAAVLSRLY